MCHFFTITQSACLWAINNLPLTRLLKKIKDNLPRSIFIRLPKKIGVMKIRSSRSSLFNHIYRGYRKPTNVLSFYYGPDYGEILVCPEIVRKEAREQGNSYKYQMTWMVLHGIIHLAGIHHEESRAIATKAAHIENRVLKQLGIERNPKSKVQMSNQAQSSKFKTF